MEPPTKPQPTTSDAPPTYAQQPQQAYGQQAYQPQQPQYAQQQYVPQQQQQYAPQQPQGAYPQGSPYMQPTVVVQQQQPAQAYYVGPAGVPVAVQPNQVVVVDTSVGMPFFGRDPCTCVCPNCNTQVVTQVTSQPGAATYLGCFALLICFWPLMCLPFCMPGCMDTLHFCPKCGVLIRRRDAME